MTQVKLTKQQAWTLIALNAALGRFINTTGEVGYFDNTQGGTGARLQALARKGLCVCGPLASKRAGFYWSFTEAGSKLAHELDLAYSHSRQAWMQAGHRWADWPPADLSGVYELSS
jgi:hypothetical protein